MIEDHISIKPIDKMGVDCWSYYEWLPFLSDSFVNLTAWPVALSKHYEN